MDQQLRAAKAVHGSRLEQLIRDNQDFKLLHPRESHGDRTGLPLWLRVHWRKNHPEASYSPNDPTGGYPRALKNLHTWMVENQDLGSWLLYGLGAENQDLPGVDLSAATTSAKTAKKRGRKRGEP